MVKNLLHISPEMSISGAVCAATFSRQGTLIIPACVALGWNTPVRPSTTPARVHTVHAAFTAKSHPWLVRELSQLGLATGPHNGPRGVMEVELGEEDKPSSDPLISEEDEEHVFVSMGRLHSTLRPPFRPLRRRAVQHPPLPQAWSGLACVNMP